MRQRGILLDLTRQNHAVQPQTGFRESRVENPAAKEVHRDNATVYVLNSAKGFEVARKGTNGFYAFVARTGDDTFKGSWPLTEYRSDILYPISFDRAGSEAQMRVFFDAAEMQAKGTPPGEQGVAGSNPGVPTA